jgi:hypothetical protein
MKMGRKIRRAGCHMAFGESRAKWSQDDRPHPMMKLVRTTSVDHGVWSHPSLHGRRGMKVSAARPQLTGLSLALPVTARPFGLGFRFDEAPSGNGTLPKEPLRARRFEPTREGEGSLAHRTTSCKSLPSLSQNPKDRATGLRAREAG